MDRENKPVGIEILLRDSMNFLTQYADPIKILQDPFVVSNWKFIVSLSEAEEAVNLFCKSSDGSNDKSTWNGIDYEPFVHDIIRKICIHSSHQQRCENYVQLCGLLASTGVGEVRRTCRAIINSVINRRFNQWVLPEANRRRKELGKNPVQRIEGKEKIALFHEYCEEFFKKCDAGKEAAPDGMWDRVIDRLSGVADKASVAEQKARLDKFIECIGKKFKYSKTQEAKGVEQTAYTAGAVSLKHLAICKNSYLKNTGMDIEGIVDAEMKERQLKCKKKMSIVDKKKALREHEWLRRVAAKEVLNEADVVYIKPQSKTMLEFMKKFYSRILNEEKKTIEMSEANYYA